MRYLLLIVLTVAGLVQALPPASHAQTFKPVMIYDSEVIDDDSWNAMIHKGIERFEKRVGVDVVETIIVKASEFDAKVKSLADQGYNPIMINNVNDAKERAIKEVTLAYPKKHYIIFNGTINIPNADFFIFSYQEATFLAGYLAAKKSQTGTIGFVGGMNIAVIKNFLCGYLNGAYYANPKLTVLSTFIGDDYTAWNNREKAYELATVQINQGADVIFSPAGGSSVGALKAAHDLKKLGIGVDSNQNHLFPGSVLTSVLVRVDNAAFMALNAAHRGMWRDKVKIMGLQENGVGLAFDEHNAPLISDELRKEIEVVKSKIILGEIKLPNFRDTETCTVGGELRF